MKSHILQLTVHVLVLSAMSAPAAIRYVNVNSASPALPYTNWTTAAKTIQAAVDAAMAARFDNKTYEKPKALPHVTPHPWHLC